MMKYTLRELLKIKNGKDHKGLADGEIPVYGSGGLMRYVNEYLYDNESILLPRKGTLSNIQYINKPFWTVDTLYYTIVDTKKTNVYYLYNLIKQFDLSRLNSGTGVPSMTFDAYYDLEVELPALTTQNRIASVLSSIDSKITLNNRINAELEAMAKTVYDYWFVQFDFPNAEGKPYKSSSGKMVWCEELKREIPEGWKVKPLDKTIETIIDNRGKTPLKLGGEWAQDKNGVIALSAKHVKSGKLIKLDEANVVTFEMFEKWMSSNKLQEGDILMTSEAPCGEFYLILNDTNYCLSQRLFAIRANKSIVKSNYLYYELSKGNGYSQILGKQSGSTVFGIRQNELRTVNVLIPDFKLQEIFDIKIAPMLYQIRNNELQNLQLSSLRDWLLPMLMNGQVSVGAQHLATEGEQEMEVERLMAAELGVEYKINKKDNSIKLDKKWTIGDRTILAAYLIKRFNCKGFGRVMLMKLLFLVEYMCELDFDLQYKVNVAGPYDDLIREIELKLRTYKLYDAKQDKFDNHVTYEEMGGTTNIESLYYENFSQEVSRINSVLDTFKNSRWEQCEIIATMYAVWNNRIIKGASVNDIALKQDFLNWDPNKEKYKDRLDSALTWMRSYEVVPKGWGKVIEK